MTATQAILLLVLDRLGSVGRKSDLVASARAAALAHRPHAARNVHSLHPRQRYDSVYPLFEAARQLGQQPPEVLRRCLSGEIAYAKDLYENPLPCRFCVDLLVREASAEATLTKGGAR